MYIYNRYSWILQILQNYCNTISCLDYNIESHSYIRSIFSFAMLLEHAVKVQAPKWKSRISPGIVSVHVISMRSVIGDLLAREIILGNSAGEIPRLRDSTVCHVNAHSTNGQRVKRYRITCNMRRMKVRQSKFRDARSFSLPLSLSFSPCSTDSVLNDVHRSGTLAANGVRS